MSASIFVRRVLAPILLFSLSFLAFAAVEPHALPDTGGYIKDNGNSRVIVFVHGLFSSPEAWRCDGDHYWPEMIANDIDPAFEGTDIYVASYPTPHKGGRMSVEDLVTLIANRLKNDGIFSRHREVIFVAHSLGGILTQQVLLTYRDDELYKKVRFLYLFGTPLEGSKTANIYKFFTRDPLLDQLAVGNFLLQDMDSKWMHSGMSNVRRYCAYETQKEHGLKIVDYNSATRGCDDAVAVPADHAHIVKPCSNRADSYIALKGKLQSLNLGHLASTHGQDIMLETSNSTDGEQVEAFQQQFRLTNRGPLAISKIHYACAISYLKTSDKDEGMPFAQNDHQMVYLVVPVMGYLQPLDKTQSTTIDCDWINRPGKSLNFSEVELVVSFVTSEGKEELYATQSFTGQRDNSGRFKWDPGSSQPSVLESIRDASQKRQRVVVVMPFGGNNRFHSENVTPEEYSEIISSWIPVLKEAGSITILSTMVSGNYTKVH